MKKNYRIRGLLACGLLGLSAITWQPQLLRPAKGLAPRSAEALREGEQAMSVTARVDTVTGQGFTGSSFRRTRSQNAVRTCRIFGFISQTALPFIRLRTGHSRQDECGLSS